MSKRTGLVKLFTLTSFALAVSTAGAISSVARDQIRIVGSSTVYPFTTVVAEEFGSKTDFRTPIVEATGTGGGFKLFCSGSGEQFPDIANASRQIKESEIQLCKSNGISTPIEIKIGFDGIAMANSVEGDKYDLTKKEIFLALAKRVPVNGALVENPYKNWNDIDPKLPAKKISVYGPPPTSGTRDAFSEIVMDAVCPDMPEFKKEFADEEVRRKQCQQMREDGAYIESGENDNLIVQKLKNDKDALGIFGYSYLDQNGATIQGAHIDGVAPTFENIAAGTYGVSRSLFIYAKAEQIGKVNGLKEFLKELVSEEAFSDEGYLAAKGLIPLKKEERDAQRKAVAAIK
jgi:phosphate transport system substrate-binding protein